MNYFFTYFPKGKTSCDHIQFHALTGCNTTSNIYGVGKFKPIQKIMKNTNVLEFMNRIEKISIEKKNWSLSRI